MRGPVAFQDCRLSALLSPAGFKPQLIVQCTLPVVVPESQPFQLTLHPILRAALQMQQGSSYYKDIRVCTFLRTCSAHRIGICGLNSRNISKVTLFLRYFQIINDVLLDFG